MDEFLIQGETLEAAAETIREHLNVRKYALKPSVGGSAGATGRIIEGSVIVYYKEFVDDANVDYDGLQDGTIHGDTPIAYEFLKNDKGFMVPVLYDTSLTDYPDELDTSEPFFYVGTATIDGVIYDKWRKIELQDGGVYTWDSDAKQYIYTNEIVMIANGVAPTDFPEKIREVYDASLKRTNSATATANCIRYPFTAWIRGEEVQGTLTAIPELSPQLGSPIAYGFDATNPDYEPRLRIAYRSSRDGYYPAGRELYAETLLKSTGTATAADVLPGKTFTSIAGVNVEGELNLNEVSYNEGYTAGYDEGYTAGYEEGKGMTWVLHTLPTATCTYYVNFVSNGESFSKITVKVSQIATTVSYNTTVVYNGINWTNSAYDTIKIKGGTDATMAEFITFLNTHFNLLFE